MVTVTQFAKFLRLPAREQLFLLAAAISWLPGAWLALRWVGLGPSQRWLGRPAMRGNNAPSFEEVERLSLLIDTAAKHSFVPSTCLTRSMVLVWLLKRRGVESRLRIGVRQENGRFDAHAWVEYEGRPVNESPDIADLFAMFPQSLPLRFSWR